MSNNLADLPNVPADAILGLKYAVDFAPVWTRHVGVRKPGVVYFAGSGAESSVTTHKSLRVTLTGDEAGVRVSGSTNGSAQALAVYYDGGGVYISSEQTGTNGVTTVYSDFELTVPTNARYIQFSAPVAADDTIVETLDTPTRSLTVWRGKRYADEASTYYAVGSGIKTSSASYKSAILRIAPSEYRYRITATVDGSATGLAVYFNSAMAYLGYEILGINGTPRRYTQHELRPPEGAKFVAISTPTASPSAVLEEGGMPNDAAIRSIYPTRIEGIKAVMFGTSIPTGTTSDNYPSKIAARLGFQMYNESVGSSMARNGIAANVTGGDAYGWTGLAWQNVAYSLSMTLAEKDDLINNWVSKWRDLLVGSSKPTTLDAATQAVWRACSYETCLVSRHLSGTAMKDLFIFEHAHNDAYPYGSDDAAKLADMLTTTSTGPGETRNRGYYLGAMSFLFDTILSYNPRARILIFGHYENARKSYVSQGQEALAGIWDFPIFKLWEKLGWTQQQVVVGGVTKTLTQLWMPDDLHPHSDTTGQASDRIAELGAVWLRDQF